MTAVLRHAQNAASRIAVVYYVLYYSTMCFMGLGGSWGSVLRLARATTGWGFVLIHDGGV